MKTLRAAVLMTLFGLALGGSLTGCIVEFDHGGGWHHHDWR